MIRRLRLALAVAVTALAVAMAIGTAAVPAQAQSPPVPAPGNRLRLTGQTTWVSDGDAFSVGLDVTTDHPADARLKITVFDPLQTRSDFTASLSDRIRTGLLRAFDPVPLSTLGRAPALSVTVNPKPTARSTGTTTTTAPTPPPSLHLTAAGVYPVRVDLVSGPGALLDRLDTHLVYVGGTAGLGSRLDVAMVVPVHAAPVVAGDGAATSPPPTTGDPATATTAPGAAGATAGGLPAEVAQGGAGLTAALAARPGVALTVAPTPQTIDTLQTGTTAERAAVAQLAQVLNSGTRQAMGSPYVRLDLPAMLSAGLDREISLQLAQGVATLAADVHASPDTSMWLHTGPLTTAALDDLLGRGIQRMVVRDSLVTPLPADQNIFTPAQPFALGDDRGRQVPAVAADSALAAHFDAQPDRVLAAHQLLADLAVIQEELPHPKGGRGVVIVPPDSWQPDGTFIGAVLDGLSSSPMLSAVTVNRLFQDVTPMQQRQSTLVRGVAPSPAGQAAPRPLSNAAAIRAARRLLTSLATILPPGSPTLDTIERTLLVSESADVAERSRQAVAAAATQLIDHTKAIVKLPGNRSLTFTARQGRIPITILSSASNPVRVSIRVASQKLAFLSGGVPGGNCTKAGTAEVCTIELRNTETTLRVPVVAKTAGVFTLSVTIESSDGVLTLATTEYTVRSIAASGVGVVLSVGAIFLLAVWWARDVRHGRRARQLIAPATGIEIDDDDWMPPGIDLTPGRYQVEVVERASVPAARPPAPRAEPPPTQPHPLPFDDATTEPPPPEPPPAPPANSEDRTAGGSFSQRTVTMAAGTLLSRLTGFGRVLALVWAFHFTRLADVYNVANTAPNILYDLVLGGVLSATLVPVFVDLLGRDDPDEGWEAISAIVTAITVVLVLLSAAFWLAAPWVIRFYLVLNNSATAGDQRAVGTTLLRLFVPQLFLLGGIAVTTALLNARRHFAAPAFSPIVNNLVGIAAIVGTRLVASDLSLPGLRHDQGVLLLLGFGTTAGYLLQFLIQLPPMVRAGFRLRPIWDLDHPAVRTVVRLSLWTFGSVMANQIAFNLILVLADKRAGDVTVFQTAYQFFQLPYAIFAVSIASVITPDLSQQWSNRDLAGFRRQMASGLRLTLAILIPAAVGYIVLAHPFLQLVFHHGSFPAADAQRIGTVVALFAVGLPGFSAYLLIMRAYQAMQDTRSMFVLYAVENVATLILAGALYPAMGVEGLALGWIGAYSIGSIVAFAHLRRRTGGLEGPATAAGLARVAVATAVMAVPVVAFTHLFHHPSGVALLAEVAGGALIGAGVYTAAARVLGIGEINAALRLRSHP